MIFTCKNCRKKDTIEWIITGYVTSMTLHFVCHYCDQRFIVYVDFPQSKGKKQKIKVEYEDSNYIG